MNHYPRNVGDFIKATLGMTLAQRGAYTAILDIYYAEESPLPVDEREVQDLAICRSKAERDAVSFVLRKFFDLREDGWHQKRADEEIAAYRLRVDQARANGANGGRPKKPNGNRPGFREVTEPETDQVTGSKANQNHNQNHNATVGLRQPSLIQGPNGPLSGEPDDHDSKSAKAEKLRGFRAEAVAVIGFLNAKAQRSYRPDGPNVESVVALLKSGYSPREIRQVIAARARKWKGDPKMDEYLRPKTLFGRTNFANYVGELGRVEDDEPGVERIPEIIDTPAEHGRAEA